MTKTQRPIVHGRDHERGGADPIRLVWETDGTGTGLGGTAWYEATLINDWEGSAFYRRAFDSIVELAGSIGGGDSGSVAFTLPVDFRPDYDVSYLASYDLGGDALEGAFNAARIVVTTDGNVTVWYPLA